MEVLVSTVFNAFSVPADTYIRQKDGLYEDELKRGLREEGTLCLLTGSSKTGKTSLYGKVLEDLGKIPIQVRCATSLKADEFWNYPLENLDFSRLKTREDGGTTTVGGTISGSGALGWGWIGKITTTITGSLSKASTDKDVREAILARPSPSHLIPLLKMSNAVLVVEDFHYLKSETQQEIFQQWKIFTDNAISVIVVGTTHHGVDLANANPDLVGRILHIELERWSEDDLRSIASKGLRKLNVTHSSTVTALLSKESAGLPIIVQQACSQLFSDRGLEAWDPERTITFSDKETMQALHHVAIKWYKGFEGWYNKLVFGPRKKARKYDTYQVILALFTQDPPTFSLRRDQIDERLRKSGIAVSEVPPAASIKSTLAALQSFQAKNNFELLEWSKADSTVYILMPSFLFYLRWREVKSFTTIGDIFNLLLGLARGVSAVINAPAVDQAEVLKGGAAEVEPPVVPLKLEQKNDGVDRFF